MKNVILEYLRKNTVLSFKSQLLPQRMLHRNCPISGFSYPYYKELTQFHVKMQTSEQEYLQLKAVAEKGRTSEDYSCKCTTTDTFAENRKSTDLSEYKKKI